MTAKTFPFRISHKKDMDIFRGARNEHARDLLRIANSIFEAEKAAKDNISFDKVEIFISLEGFMKLSDGAIAHQLAQMFSEITGRTIEIIFRTSSKPDYRHARRLVRYPAFDSVCLFSGGVDSFVGLANAARLQKRVVGVFIAHSDQTGVINIVSKLRKTHLKSVPCYTVYAPAIKPRRNKHGYSNLRGFLYMLLAGAVCEVVSAKRVLITECGSTMYQPRFGPLDSITHTTHPLVQQTALEVIRAITSKQIDFVTPFEDMTKAEIMAFSDVGKLIPYTHSCITARFRDNCGLCYGCVLRRLGAIVAGTPDANYHRDIISDPSCDDDNLITLLRFSYFFVADREKIENYSLTKIIRYGKQDLFSRQSLDVLAAMYVLHGQGTKFSPRVQRAYDLYVATIPEDTLKKRVAQVRSGAKKPDFDSVLKI